MIDNQSIYLTFAVILFVVGAAGAICRRNAIVVFMCIEIMLAGVSIAFVTFSRANHSLDGIFMVLFIMAVAAAEAAVGLAIFVLMYRKTGSIDLDKFNLLKW